MKCKICNSPYLDYVNDLLKKGISTRRIEKLLREEHDVRISHNAINDHRRNHLLPLYQGDDITKLLYDSGNHRLSKRIERTRKIIREYPKCMCSPFENRPIKKKGLVFICSTCNGWIRGDVGRSIQREQKRQRRESRQKERLGFAVRKERFYE